MSQHTLLQTPPLALYVHLPWCVRKCPYCDFNSHTAAADLPEQEYVDALIRDLDYDLAQLEQRPLTSIFFGGGTPSLFSADAIGRILDAVRSRFTLLGDCEITLEANPGATDEARFSGYRAAGVNRLSIGVQSLSDCMLQRLGRIHDAKAARQAVTAARAAGFDNFNLDMMFALPGQSLAQAAHDLRQLIDLAPEHLSYYQLTLEPGTPFHHRPPVVPDGDAAFEMHAQATELLAAAGYTQYEVSAWARPGRECTHNLNYWQFGDYLGIGAGAHAKLTDTRSVMVTRLHKQPMPRRYTQSAGSSAGIIEARTLTPDDLQFEFLMNALRLNHGFSLQQFEQRSGLSGKRLITLAQQQRVLLDCDGRRMRASALGRAHLDTLLIRLLPQAA